MEAIIGIVLGLVVGLIVGALLMKFKSGGETASLRANLDAANRTAAEFKDESESWRAKAEESKLEVTKFQTEFENSNRSFEAAESEIAALKKDVEKWRSQADGNAAESVKLLANLNAANNQLAERADIEKVLGDQFKIMANEAISNNNDAFVKAADEKIGSMVKPLSDELKRIEKARDESQGSLKQQLESLVQNNNSLTQETRNLTNALKRPEVRGSWGEMQLRRVVELAGMSNYCDYEEQVSVTTDDGSRERPDMIVRMPNERTIVVDAKTPMNAYITAMESDTDAEREDAIRLHAKQVRERAQDLSQKSYYRLFDRSPDFVVMFLPGEFLLQQALEQDHDLIDWAMQRNVVIATPNTLMALLKAVAMGWREAQIEEEAAKVAALGQELHDRIRIFAGHMVKMRSSINSTVENFNNGIGSLESRVLTSARRFKDLGIATSQDIPELIEIDSQTRDFRSPQLRALPEPNGVGDD